MDILDIRKMLHFIVFLLTGYFRMSDTPIVRTGKSIEECKVLLDNHPDYRKIQNLRI